MKIINSVQNQEIKLVAALKNRKDRDEQKRFIAEGLRVITTFIQAGWQPVALYATDATLADAQELTSALSITLVSPEIMQKISHATTSSGLLAVFTIPDKPSLASIKPGLVLANLSDPGNAGTLMRTCAAMNVQCVVMVEGVDPWHPKVIQATAGTIAQLKIFQCTWQELVANKNNLTLHALTVSGGKAPEVIQANNALLVVGNEAHGLPEQWIADCDDAITIPMPGNTESLNAAVAGSIALYLTFKNVKI